MQGRTYGAGLASRPFWTRPIEELLQDLGSGEAGLSGEEAERRLASDGQNTVSHQGRRGLAVRFGRKLIEPLVLILLCAAVASGVMGDWPSLVIIAVVVLASTTLDTWQEYQAEVTADALKRSIAVRAEVRRDGRTGSIEVERLVRGDVVELAAGDLVPGDGVLLAGVGCQTNEALLTGEPFPVEKQPGPVDTDEVALARNALFAGTAVVSGTGLMAVVATGPRTRFGGIAAALDADQPPTAFERGLRSLGNVILRMTVALVLFVLVVHIAMGRAVMDTVLFSLALAVGLTPELLPMVMTVSLSRGAQRMAKRRVVVKRLSAIHDLGSMDVLCTDKTGTLTQAQIALASFPGIDGRDSSRVLALARLNSRFSAGLRNALDDAILATAEGSDEAKWSKIAERPFDFERRRASVLIGRGSETILVVKGAAEEVLQQCVAVEGGDGAVEPLDEALRSRLAVLQDDRAAQGCRLLGIAWRRLDGPRTAVKPSDETQLVFVGFCAFLDPPKASAGAAIERLRRSGTAVKIVSGDAEAVVRHVAAALSVPVRGVLTGSAITALNDTALAAAVEGTDLFARVSPDQKTRIVRALQARGLTVGFLGDGVNDAPAIHAADVGLSVDGATEIARSAAAIVILAPDLGIVADGIEEGRRTYHNIMKYVRMGTSSNFGNMLSMAAASLVLPFLPLTPIQILLNNLLYDVSEIGLPFDVVDAEALVQPRHWDMRDVVRFTLLMGPLSSLFDGIVFFLLLRVFHADPMVFRTAWFIESIVTQIADVFVIRTAKPAWLSRPHAALVATSLGTMVCSLLVVLTPVRSVFGFAPLPLGALGAMALVAVAYLVAAEMTKRVAFGRQRPGQGAPLATAHGGLMQRKAKQEPIT